MCIGTAIDYRNWHLGVGRRFRSLKFWFALRARGVNGFQKYITDVCLFICSRLLVLTYSRVSSVHQVERQVRTAHIRI